MKNFFCLILILMSIAARSQSYNPAVASINNQLRILFENLDTQNPNYAEINEALYDRAGHFTDTNLWNANHLRPVTLNQYMAIYDELRNMLVDTNDIPNPFVYYNQALQTKGDTIALGIMLHHYSTFKSDGLFSDKYFVENPINGKLYDNYKIEMLDTILGTWQINPNSTNEKIYENADSTSPYREEILMAIAPFEENHLFSEVTFSIDPNQIIIDSKFAQMLAGEYILQIDFGDGNGYITIDHTQKTTYTIDYSGINTQNKVLKLGLASVANPLVPILVGGTIIKGLFGDNEPDPRKVSSDFKITVGDIEAGVYEPCLAGPYSAARKFLIFVEGYQFSRDVDKSTFESTYFKTFGTTGLGDLRNHGYTVVVVEFKKPHKGIDEKGLQLRAFLNHLKCNYVSYESNQNVQPFVILAKSMGGVVSQYALSHMEKYPYFNDDCMPELMHNTRLLISIDAPHQGANIPIGLQQFYANLKIGLAALILPVPALVQIADAIYGLNAKPVKQISLYHLGDLVPFENIADQLKFGFFPYDFTMTTEYGPASDRSDFVTSLRNLKPHTNGYPEHCKLVSVSNGLLTGEQVHNNTYNNIMQSGDKIIGINFENSIQILRIFRVDLFSADLNIMTSGGAYNQNVFEAQAGQKFWKLQIKWVSVYNKSHCFRLFGKRRCFNINIRRPNGLEIVYDYIFSIGTTAQNKNALAYDVNAGGMVQFYGAQSRFNKTYRFLPFEANFFNANHDWNQLGQDGKAWFDIDLATWNFTSDGLHFSFIPVKSAFDVDANIGLQAPREPLNENLYALSPNQLMSRTPFDVVYGQLAQPGYPNIEAWINPGTDEVLNRFQPGINGDHMDMQNLKLGDTLQNGLDAYVINREVGEDMLYLDNTNTPMPWIYEAYLDMHAGAETNPWYVYQGTNNTEYLDWIFKEFGVYHNGIVAKSNSLNSTANPSLQLVYGNDPYDLGAQGNVN